MAKNKKVKIRVIQQSAPNVLESHMNTIIELESPKELKNVIAVPCGKHNEHTRVIMIFK